MSNDWMTGEQKQWVAGGGSLHGASDPNAAKRVMVDEKRLAALEKVAKAARGFDHQIQSRAAMNALGEALAELDKTGK